MNAAAPGWYHAEGDPPGTERYWDGTQWTEGPRPVGGGDAGPAGAASDAPGSGMPEMDLGGGGPGASMPDISTPSTPDVSAPSMPDFSTPSAATPGASMPPMGGGVPGAAPTGFGAVPGAAYAEKSQATTALVLSIVGLLCCGPLGGVGAWFGYQEREAIDAGRRDPSKRGTAQAAFIIGLIAVAFTVIGILFFVVASAGS